MHLETLAVHSGHTVDEATAAVTPAIHLSTTFARESDGSYRAGFLYSRYTNPNRAALEQCLAALEGGVAAACFSSGSAATMTLLQVVGPGHVATARFPSRTHGRSPLHRVLTGRYNGSHGK